MSATKDLFALPKTKKLATALVTIQDVSLMQAFLRDIMTEKEITEFSNRLLAAEMLIAGNTYTDIAEATQLSSRTIARISQWIKTGKGGYARVLTILEAHHGHILPTRD